MTQQIDPKSYEVSVLTPREQLEALAQQVQVSAEKVKQIRKGDK